MVHGFSRLIGHFIKFRLDNWQSGIKPKGGYRFACGQMKAFLWGEKNRWFVNSREVKSQFISDIRYITWCYFIFLDYNVIRTMLYHCGL